MVWLLLLLLLLLVVMMVILVREDVGVLHTGVGTRGPAPEGTGIKWLLLLSGHKN